MDKDVERVCHGCQVTTHPTRCLVLPPIAPWQHCSADVLGRLLWGESVLVVADYFSRFLEVVILKSTSSAKMIEAISPMFGPQFASEEFETFLRSHGVKH